MGPNLVDINWWAILLAALAALPLRALWYRAPRAGWRTHATAFAAAFVSAAALGILLRPNPPLFIAAHAGFLTGLAYVAMALGLNDAYRGRPLRAWLRDAGFHTLQFTLYGVILGLWH